MTTKQAKAYSLDPALQTAHKLMLKLTRDLVSGLKCILERQIREGRLIPAIMEEQTEIARQREFTLTYAFHSPDFLRVSVRKKCAGMAYCGQYCVNLTELEYRRR